MAKRLRTVFSSHSQLAHVWAQQSQPEGRASRMLFTNTTDIYSYGFHYLAAKIHTVKGQRFCLMRSDPYSVTTGGHLGDIARSVRGLMPNFRVPGEACLRSPAAAIKALDKNVSAEIDRALARKFFADSSWREDCGDREYHIEAIEEALNTTNKLRAIMGRKPLKMPTKFKEAVAHLDKLTAKYNSPARVAKRALKAKERKEAEANRRAARAAENAKNLADFRAGNPFGWIDSDFDLLRIKGDRVETSGGAEVPLKQARLLISLADKDGPFALSGKQIGHFTVNNVAAFDTDNGSDILLEIGCHRILLSEAKRVLKGSHLSVVGGVA